MTINHSTTAWCKISLAWIYDCSKVYLNVSNKLCYNELSSLTKSAGSWFLIKLYYWWGPSMSKAINSRILSLWAADLVNYWLTNTYILPTWKLKFIYSLKTLWYSVRNLDVARFLISSINTGLQTLYTMDLYTRRNSGRMPFLTSKWSAENWTRDLLFEKPMPYAVHHGHSQTFIRYVQYKIW